MTSDEWFYEFERLLGPASERKAQLAVVACCRRVWHLMTDRRHRAAVEAAEVYADRASAGEGFRTSMEPVRALARTLPPGTTVEWDPCHYITQAVRHLSSRDNAPDAASFAARSAARTAGVEGSQEWIAALDAEGAAVRELMVDVVGPLNRPTAAGVWLTTTVLALARQMYEVREFSAMPILADALQDAGCASEDVLNHCRGDGPHVRGCWVVDLALGKV
jgi:hypothetical protein